MRLHLFAGEQMFVWCAMIKVPLGEGAVVNLSAGRLIE